MCVCACETKTVKGERHTEYAVDAYRREEEEIARGECTVPLFRTWGIITPEALLLSAKNRCTGRPQG